MTVPAEFVQPLAAADRRVVAARDLGEWWLALLERGRVVELLVCETAAKTQLGQIFKGAVLRHRPGVRALLVDAGLSRPVFVPAAGAGPSPVAAGDAVLVQLSREAQQEKGWRGALEVKIAGFALVFAPGGSRHGVSRRIEDPAARERLTEILEQIGPPEGGLIARTAARHCSAAELAAELEQLLARWRAIAGVAAGLSAPAVVTAPEHPAVQFVREHFGMGLTEVIVDGEQQELEAALALAPPTVRPSTRRHAGPASAVEAYGLLAALDEALATDVPLPSGGRLSIESTRALTAIDVDSGAEDAASFPETALRTNLEAAFEAARQVRLRQAGGLIAIDFIDMGGPEARAQVHDALVRALAPDPQRLRIAPLSDFWVAQVTRQRRRAPLESALTAPCPCCGRGRAPTPEFAARRLLRRLRRQTHGRPDDRVQITAPAEVVEAGQTIVEQWGAASGLPASPRIQWRIGAPGVTLL